MRWTQFVQHASAMLLAVILGAFVFVVLSLLEIGLGTHPFSNALQLVNDAVGIAVIFTVYWIVTRNIQ